MISKENCTGCQACRLICPAQCITIVDDIEGFQIPFINKDCCTGCNLCEERCPEYIYPKLKKNCIRVIGAKFKNDALLSKSASGGVFVGIAVKMLEIPGNAVFGCVFDEDIVAKHVCITDMKDIEPLQSSKYVQSDVGDTYLQSKELLEEGKAVFFTGCPCQIAGLYAFLGRDYDNLLTADLICHGVPSPLLFKKYIDKLGKKNKGKIIYYNFRSKDKHGWGLKYQTKPNQTKPNQTKHIIPNFDPYYNSFIGSRTLRNCCYSCKYADSKRVADITLGDFWGVEDFHPEFYSKRGVSVVLINTNKGQRLVQSVKDDFEIIETSIENVINHQGNLKKASPKHKYRDIVYRNIYQPNFDIYCEKALKPGLFAYFIYLYSILPIPISVHRVIVKAYRKIIR